MSFTVTPEFPADFRVWTIRSFKGAPGVRAFALAAASLDTRCFPLLFAHRAFIVDEILDLAAALILAFFRRGTPFFRGAAWAPVSRCSSRCSLSIRSRIATACLRFLIGSVVRRLLCMTNQ